MAWWFCAETCCPSKTDTATSSCAAPHKHQWQHILQSHVTSHQGFSAQIQLTEGSSSKSTVKALRIRTSTNTAKQKLARENSLHSAQQTEVYCENLECIRVVMTTVSLQAPERESLAADGPSVAVSNRPRLPGIFHMFPQYYLGHSDKQSD